MNAYTSTHAFLPAADDPDTVSRRADGWSAANQRAFLEALAEGHGVDAACARVGLSAASAYAFRRTAKGAAFALGWRAASLVARDAIAETLLVRALAGQVETWTRADGAEVSRRRFDNRLAMSLLARLDRQVEAAPDADVAAARLVAQEFDAYLGELERGGGAARAGLFLARRVGGTGASGGWPDTAGPAIAGVGNAPDLGPIFALAAADRLASTGVATAGEVAVDDLDFAARADWTAVQWARAEAAGLIAIAAPGDDADGCENPPGSQLSQHSADDAPDAPVWWDDYGGGWRTRFPPPDGADLDRCEIGDAVAQRHIDYERRLTPAEHAAMGDGPLYRSVAEQAELTAERDRWFAALALPDDGDPPDIEPDGEIALPYSTQSSPMSR